MEADGGAMIDDQRGLFDIPEGVTFLNCASRSPLHGPHNLALLRKLALNLAKLEPSKGSMRAKLKRAGWDNAFLATCSHSSTKFKCDSPVENPLPRSPSAV